MKFRVTSSGALSLFSSSAEPLQRMLIIGYPMWIVYLATLCDVIGFTGPEFLSSRSTFDCEFVLLVSSSVVPGSGSKEINVAKAGTMSDVNIAMKMKLGFHSSVNWKVNDSLISQKPIITCVLILQYILLLTLRNSKVMACTSTIKAMRLNPGYDSMYPD